MNPAADDPALGALPAAFPADFTWGVATSAYQIEGAAAEDGKGPSVWDRFCRQPGSIADGSHGDIACDHYHRWPEDLDIARSLGVDAYRFSVSWPRVQPAGQGAWNPQGLDFYERLVDGLLARGLRPHLTLNHWDLPDALQTKGGWAHRDTVQHFVDYALGVQARLGDRLAAITTHNEPWVISVLGHERGQFAPGIRQRAVAMQVAHHLLLSHGLALQALRAAGSRAPLGIVLNLAPVQPARARPEDIAAARLEDGRLLRWYMDPLFGRGYPGDVLADLGPDAPHLAEGDLAAISTPLDFLGVNYYSRQVVSADGSWQAAHGGRELTAMGWEVCPEGLVELMLRLHQDYPLPAVHVTENGSAFEDHLVDGRVADVQRTRYLQQHIAALAEVLRHGVPLRGYMVWSLLDNFEWASGCEKRFGLVHVDYSTQARTLKDSGHWYRSFLQQHHRARAA